MKNLLINFVLLTWPINAFAHWDGGGHMGNWHHMWGGSGFMWIILILIIGVVLYLLIQHSKLKNSGISLHESALDILKKRYAKGEITKEVFDQMKKDLEN